MTEERRAEIQSIMARHKHDSGTDLARDYELAAWCDRQPDPEQARKDIVTVAADIAIDVLTEWANNVRQAHTQQQLDD